MQRQKSKSKSNQVIKSGRNKVRDFLAMNSLNSLVSGLNSTLMPTSLKRKLKYAESVRLTIAGAGIGLQQYRGNDLFDPDFTGTGNQPEGFDQICPTFYKRFRVVSSCMRVWLSCVGTTAATQSMLVCVVPETVSTAYSTFEAAVCAPLSRTTAFATENSGLVQLTQPHLATSRVFGVPVDAVLENDQYSGDSANSPAKPWFWSIYAVASDRATASNIDTFTILEYDVVFTDRVELEMS